MNWQTNGCPLPTYHIVLCVLCGFEDYVEDNNVLPLSRSTYFVLFNLLSGWL